MKVTVDEWGMKQYFKEAADGSQLYYREDDHGFFFEIHKLRNGVLYREPGTDRICTHISHFDTVCFKDRVDAYNFLKHGIINNQYEPDFHSVQNAISLMWCCGCGFHD